MQFDAAKLKEMYTTMERIKAFEDATIAAWRDRKSLIKPRYTRGTEAVATGVCSVLGEKDYILTSHRPYAPMVARGARLDRMLAEAFGKETGYCKGKGGSTHLSILDRNIVAAVPVVGRSIPIAAGVGLGCKLQKLDRVCACFFGDGASATGAFHEGVGLASVWDLPVVFVIENNQYANQTPVRDQTKLDRLSDRAKGYNIPGVTVDGNDVIAVAEAASEAVSRARSGKGPTILEASTYTTGGKSTTYEGIRWRSEEEVDQWKKRDPIVNFRAKLLADKIMTEAEAAGIQAGVIREVEDAVRFASESPQSNPDGIFDDLYYQGVK